MIDRIFWDLDEVLVHTSKSDPHEPHFKVKFESDDYTSHIMIRPCAKRVVEYSRSLVGPENVYILTTSLYEYALKVCELGDLQFPPEHVIARETLELHKVSFGYGGAGTVPGKLASKKNVLIDDKTPREQSDKIDFLGLGSGYRERYLEVHPYSGVNFPEDNLESLVQNFLQRLHNDT